LAVTGGLGITRSDAGGCFSGSRTGDPGILCHTASRGILGAAAAIPMRCEALVDLLLPGRRSIRGLIQPGVKFFNGFCREAG